MAYNNGFPMGYQYYPQPVMQPQMIPQQMQQPVQPQVQQPQVQQQYANVPNGFIRVRNENEAKMYPVAPANSVTFIDENAPYVYTKTVNMGQLDRPIFEKYRLVKEEDTPEAVTGPQKPAEQQLTDLSRFALHDDLAALKSELDAIKADVETFRGDLYGIAGKKKPAAKKEVTTDE